MKALGFAVLCFFLYNSNATALELTVPLLAEVQAQNQTAEIEEPLPAPPAGKTNEPNEGKPDDVASSGDASAGSENAESGDAENSTEMSGAPNPPSAGGTGESTANADTSSASNSGEKPNAENNSSASHVPETTNGSAPPSPEKGEETEPPKPIEPYSALSKDYLMVGVGERWYYEKYDDAGEVLFRKWYEKDRVTKVQTFFYEAKLLVRMEETEANETAIYYYDERHNAVKIKTAENGEPLTITKTYNEKNLVTEIKTEKKGRIVLQKLFYKKDGSLLREENYECDILVSVITYTDGKKHVVLYNNGKEIKSFDE